MGRGSGSCGRMWVENGVNMQKRAFAVVGPSIWNGLPLSIRTLPRNLSQTFLSQLKAVLFGRVGVGIASE